MPTATKVINLAQAKKEQAVKTLQHDLDEIDRHFDNLKTFRRAISNSAIYGVLDNEQEILPSVIAADENLSETIADIDRYIKILQTIKNKLIVLKGGRK